MGGSNPHTSAKRQRGLLVEERQAAHLGAALHARVAADRREPAVRPADQPAQQADVEERLDGVDAVDDAG